MRPSLLQLFAISVGIVAAACGGTVVSNAPAEVGGAVNAAGGAPAAGGTLSVSSGGSDPGEFPGVGGDVPITGGRAAGGTPASGGSAVGAGGMAAPGGSAAPETGGMMPATGGSEAAIGGSAAAGGQSVGGASATGGAAAGGDSAVNCSDTMPTGGTDHCDTTNASGTAGGLSWSLWLNGAASANTCITTFDSTPAFAAKWSDGGDFLARIGLEWDSGGKTYDQYGTISAQFAYTKTGTGGGYSYIGIYGWTTNPCVEYYIVEDSFNTFPFNPYNTTQKSTATIDGEVYKLFVNITHGMGGSRCSSGASNWQQYWSVRQKARQCGTISITEHFNAWKAAGMQLGNLLEAKILVEVGGGTGSLNFPVANVTAK